MKILHGIIAIGFILLGASIYTRSHELVPALLAILIGNVSLVAVSLESAMDRSPIELPDRES